MTCYALPRISRRWLGPSSAPVSDLWGAQAGSLCSPEEAHQNSSVNENLTLTTLPPP